MKRNLLRKEEDADPISAVSNLFDVAMVFVVVLMVTLVSRYSMTEVFSQENYTMVKSPGEENMEIIMKEGQKINRYTPLEDQQKNGKKGKKVGIAYELDNGETIYVPEEQILSTGLSSESWQTAHKRACQEPASPQISKSHRDAVYR